MLLTAAENVPARMGAMMRGDACMASPWKASGCDDDDDDSVGGGCDGVGGGIGRGGGGGGNVPIHSTVGDTRS